MSDNRIEPKNVTKPIQLLAAWLVGLILINGSFLGAAKVISHPSWAAGALVIAAIINVPIFLGLIFFLQTKFRAELQEDTYYSKHLDKITGNITKEANHSESFLSHLQDVKNHNDGKFTSINKALEELSSIVKSIRLDTFDPKEIESKVEEAKSSISEIEKKNILRNAKLALNTKLKDYRKISKALINEGFKIDETFGKSDLNKLTISYLPNVSKVALKNIYLTLKPFGFKRIDLDASGNNLREAEIYIGSYIDEFPNERASLVIDGELESMLLDESITIEQLNDYILSESA